MNYNKIYKQLINRAKDRELITYSEKHHIVPKCLGGGDEIENLVKLTPEEHYLAHQLLVKIYPEEPRLVYAVWRMIYGDSEYVLRNNKTYGWLRRKYINVCKNRTGSKNSSYGKPWYHNPSTKESGKFLPGDEPAGYLPGRVTKKEKTCKDYIPSMKGKVVAKDKDGVTRVIPKDEFETGDYVGSTKGTRTVLDRTTSRHRKIDEKEYQENRSKYAGPCLGKVNVIDKISGERKQIPKEEFNKGRYLSLGDQRFLFKCKDILTGREKNINIYEWNNVKDQYEIIDLDKFKKALEKKEI